MYYYYFVDKDMLIRNTTEDKTNKDVLNRIDEYEFEPEPVAGPSGIAITHKNLNEFQLSDGDSDSNLTSYSNSVPIIENINEYEFGSDWESETEKNESLPLPKKYQNKNIITPALTYMLEHSSLTQEQIMQLIEQTKKNNNKKTNTHSSASTKSLSILEPIINNTKNEKEKQQKITEENLIGCNQIVEKNIPIYPLEDSNSGISAENVENHSSNFQFVEDNDKLISDEEKIECHLQSTVVPITLDTHTTDSDSDEFIEIPDVPIPNSKHVTKNHVIEIAFKSNEKIENDLFADVFKESSQDIFSQSTESVTSSLIVQTISTTGSPDLNKQNDNENSKVLGTSTSKSCNFQKTSLNKKADLHEEGHAHIIQSSNMDEEQIKKTQESKIFINAESEVACDIPKLSEDTMNEKYKVLPTNKTELLELKV